MKLVELPMGLRRYVKDISRELGEEIIFLGDPVYGSCHLYEEIADFLGLEEIIHYSHTPFYTPNKRVVFKVNQLSYSEDVFSIIEEEIRSEAGKVGVITNAQFLKLAYEVKKRFKDRVELKRGRLARGLGQVLGCDFSAARVESRKLIFLGDGLFHPIGARISTGKEVLSLNPVTCEQINVEKEAERFLKMRFHSIFRAKRSNSFGVILGAMRGQFRMKDFQMSVRLLQEEGKEVFRIVSKVISPEIIEEFGLDCYVICACPRIVDEQPRFKKPLITPRELEIAFGRRDEYVMDEISEVEW